MTKKEKEILTRIEEKLDKLLERYETQGPQEDPEVAHHVIISCDASIKENPGGPASVAFVIRRPHEKPMLIGKGTPATTNNQAEYDAVYEGLRTFFNLVNRPGCKVEVRSDSQLVINQINGAMTCNDKSLERRRDLIREFVRDIPTPVEFVWRPRNSTPDLEQANHRAQEILGVSPH